jgi:hypothetical protein
MLIKLTSNTSGEIIMFAKHARQLFEIIGKECTARGVFTREQLPEALVNLQRAVDEEKLAARLRADEERAGEAPPHEKKHEKKHDKQHEQGDDDAEQKPEMQVGLGQRARPLISLMEWTVKEKGFILWEADHDF